MRFRTVLFDLDGTLVDHFAAIHRTHAQTREHFGLTAPTPEQVRRAVGGGLETAVARVFGPENAHLLPEAIQVYRSFWPNNLLHELAMCAGAREVLAALRQAGVQCAVFTNKHGPSARAIMEHLKLSGYLDGVFGAFDTPWLKPQIEFAEHALKTLKADGKTTCLVGDSPYDVEAAHNAGFPCYAVTTGTHGDRELREAGADGVYPDLLSLARAEFGLAKAV